MAKLGLLAVLCLGCGGKKTAVAPAVKAVDSDTVIKSSIEGLKSEIPFNRAFSAGALKQQGRAAEAALPLLKEVEKKDSDPNVRKAAAEAIKAIQG